ncbi:MAG: hypothetical protein ABI895_01225 [Deltaproteobacteria bacterium]
MATGTIYGLPEPDGARTTEHNCFDVEGASVTITAADGLVLQTLTNEAGNFYFEGRQSSLKTPFRVMVEYTSPEGVYSRQFMDSNPSYGGFAVILRGKRNPRRTRCQARSSVPDEVVDKVYPIYTGPGDE